MEIARLLWGTVVLRPYVFAFLAAFLCIGSRHMGWTRTVFLLGWGYAVAFASEWSSVRTGFPYGLYHYVEAPTRDLELWVAGVPFMDSLSYTFLAYFSWSTALFAVCPRMGRGLGLGLAETGRLRRSSLTVGLAVLLMVSLDVVIDPVAHRGERWFLGRLYYYPEPGPWFGVPLSNFAGWALVGSVILGGLAAFDGWRARRGDPGAGRGRPLWAAPLWGPAVYTSVLGFNLTVTFAIGETLLGLAGLALALPLVSVLAVSFAKPSNRATPEEEAAHRAEFGARCNAPG
ncbi:MAG: carotenoid biosynthesis protein [Planctomycetes bacterium]|nr:carotenoid biosynthesis protein [Planctomycetota bacterium]